MMKKALLALVIAGAMQTGAGLPSRTLIAPRTPYIFLPFSATMKKTLPRSFP
ncbi:MAG: hypothetical protein HDR39_02105 [Treponema sp.]|nr:hypothetical protein [Treponema sp.]